MLSTCVIGASGYTGAELIKIIHQHPEFELAACFVSQGSSDANKHLGDVHASLGGQSLGAKHTLQMQELDPAKLNELANSYDAIFLATPHEASHDWASALLQGSAKIFDLSGAFRLPDAAVFEKYYGFQHQHPEVQEQAIYGLAEWYEESIKGAKFVAVPGCYPTASLLALKPLTEAGLVKPGHRPVINATSGVSGAGKKPSATTSFYEVSLQAYGVLGHRHTPEIDNYSQTKVIFTPHLGQFKRGILATLTVAIKEGVSASEINKAYKQQYADKALIRLRDNWPKVDDVAHTPFCDICWKFDEDSGYLVVSSAIDNLLKGAASQAVQCANLAFNFPSQTGLISSWT